MKERIAPAVALALLGWLALAGVFLAQTVGPAIGWSVISGGGAPASGGNVTLSGTLGQLASVPAAGGTVSMGPGYWIAQAVAPLVLIAPNGAGAQLSWTNIAADAGGYEAWWSTAPYFTPVDGSPDHAPVTAPPWTYTHPGASGVNYYYVVLGVNAVGQTSPLSNRTGRFNFALTPGTP